MTSPFGMVQRIWPGSTVVCLGAGPSLTPADVDTVRGRARVIAVNRSIGLAPWADVWFAADGRLWGWEAERVSTFPGRMYSLEQTAATKAAGCTLLRNRGIWGLSRDPGALCNGRNSGYGAINLAFLLGAARIVLLGYDCGPGPDGMTHWHGDHPHGAGPTDLIFRSWRAAYKTLAPPLTLAGVTVINCSRQTTIEAFRRADLAAVLDGVVDNQQSGLLESHP